MADFKSRSQSKMNVAEAFRTLGIPRSSTIEEINRTFKSKLSIIERRYADQPDEMVTRADSMYAAYRAAYMSKDGADEDQLLPMTLVGPDAMLNVFGIEDVPVQSLKVQMESQAQYKDGKLVKKESHKTESFVNKDGKREIRVYDNGKLIKHTIDGKTVTKSRSPGN